MKGSFKNQIFSFLCFILGLIVFTFSTNIYNPVLAEKSTEILWDTYLVPHIYAKNPQALFKAFAWAQMNSHANLLLRLYGQARGRAAQYWGKDYLESDRWVQTMGVPERAQQWYEAQNKDFRALLDSFAEGINAYAIEHPDLIDHEVKAVLPVSGVDLLAHYQRVVHFTFVINPDELSDLNEEKPLAGSNAWAIAPSRSAEGHTMLLANPHLPWSDLYLWYEAQLVTPKINAYGAALVGFPVLEIAFNDYLGWTHTVNTYDGWDAYELELVDNGYRFDGQVLPFKKETQTIKVKQDDGTLVSQELIWRRSVHGPVFTQPNGKAIAVRVAGLDQAGGLQQWWDMAQATNFAQFEAAIKKVQIPMFTIMYGDRDGHIMHLFNGQIPIRSQGNFANWKGIIAGNTSKTLWTKTHLYKDLPRVLDPKSGWLQNANDPPWTTTFPVAINADDYPSYMASPGPMSLRAQRSAKMLIEDEHISFAELIKYKHSTEIEMANRILDDLIPLAQKHNSELVRQAAQVLQQWDRQANADSRGAVLFTFWTEEIDLDSLFATPWSQDAPLTTPDGLADPKSAIAALEVAATKVQAAYGSLNVSWGQVFRISQKGIDLPANGASDPLGVFRHLWYVPEENGRFSAIGGDSFVAVIEFSNPVKAMVINSYGNSTEQHLGQDLEQLKLFADQKLRPVWRSRQEIEQHTALVQVLLAN